MTGILDNLQFALSVTGPIMLVLVMGVLLARWHIINDAFIDAGSKLVFNVTLPALLFIIISQTRFEQTANVALIVIGVLGTLLCFVAVELIAPLFVNPPRDRGVVVQGSFRGVTTTLGSGIAQRPGCPSISARYR